MNDPLEINFGITVLLDILKKNKVSSEVIKIIEEKQTENQLNALSLRRDLIFVFSFTELRDYLPFWVQYANYGNGISMGFVNNKLIPAISPIIPNNRFMYFPVQYYATHNSPSKRNISIFENVIVDYYSDMGLLYSELDSDSKHNFRYSLFAISKLLAAFIKHDFHEDEKEWRYVVFSGMGENNIEIISNEGKIKMFYNIDFTNSMIMNNIDSITVGPCHGEDDRASAALEIALWKYQGLRHKVERSNGKIVNPKT